MLEIEIKIPLTKQQISIVLNELRQLSNITDEINYKPLCTFLGEKTELDYYYQHPCRNFAQTDEALRIRDKKVAGSSESFELTYKGAKIDSITKTRREISVKIDSLENIQALLSSLGFFLAGQVIKNRKSWKINKEGITVSIDEVKSLGTYLELEIVDVQSKYEVSAEKLFLWLRKLLKCEELPPMERRSYLELLLKRSEVSSK
ncbi:MAG: class IV adenylate cyclase [Candidatus Hodarchaeota archaeon]